MWDIIRTFLCTVLMIAGLFYFLVLLTWLNDRF